MVACDDDDPASTSGCIEQGCDVPENFSGPIHFELVAPTQLGVHCIVDDANNSLLDVADRLADRMTEFGTAAKVSFVKQTRRHRRAGLGPELSMGGKAGSFRSLVPSR